jgi:hypothetical protein
MIAMKVTVFKVRLYDVANDAPVISRRMATLRGARLMGGDIMPESAINIDRSELEPKQEWTSRDFTPDERLESRDLNSQTA